MKALRAVALSIIFLTALNAQVWSDWKPISGTDLEDRSQTLPNMGHCYIEFRDKHQGKGTTTFDVDVDYRSTALKPDGSPIVKTDTEHIVTTPANVGTARITECVGVSEIRAKAVQRH